MNAFDTDTSLTSSDASCLVSTHHSAVGRYLKNLSTTEITDIHNAGLKIWSIYEENPTYASSRLRRAKAMRVLQFHRRKLWVFLKILRSSLQWTTRQLPRIKLRFWIISMAWPVRWPCDRQVAVLVSGSLTPARFSF